MTTGNSCAPPGTVDSHWISRIASQYPEGFGLRPVAAGVQHGDHAVLNAHQRFLLAQQMEHVDYLGAAIQQVGEEIARRLDPFREVLELLDTIPGVGKKRKLDLLAAFGSVEGIKNASLEAISATPNIPANTAKAIYEHFKQSAETSESMGKVIDE